MWPIPAREEEVLGWLVEFNPKEQVCGFFLFFSLFSFLNSNLNLSLNFLSQTTCTIRIQHDAIFIIYIYLFIHLLFCISKCF
jgi:hypothetical protein